ncbi:alpha/beta hydrolase [Planctomicrobium sp.]|jgi:acetyl esterase/lipase|nr:alpha/beta hydrolase [Planctomicrobium sp.]MDB4439904.1 alpha/beta hydrolase [Planctomicrobium sp.]
MQRKLFIFLLISGLCPSLLLAEDSHPTYLLWPESILTADKDQLGDELPRRENETPPAIRVTNIKTPRIKRFDPPANKANGSAVLIIPGGAYRYAVVGKEGAEIAEWFNSIGVTAFVLYYRNPTNGLENDWLAPVQDAQQAIRLIRHRAQEWKLDPQRIGIIGFSAGGNAAAIASTKMDVPVLKGEQSEFSDVSARPDFTMLLYPWKLLNQDETGLREEVVIDQQTPPSFLVHTHDDGVTSLSSVEYYKAMKRLNRPAEIHLYQSGGHGYGLRSVKNSNVHTWTDRATAWLKVRGLLK